MPAMTKFKKGDLVSPCKNGSNVEGTQITTSDIGVLMKYDPKDYHVIYWQRLGKAYRWYGYKSSIKKVSND